MQLKEKIKKNITNRIHKINHKAKYISHHNKCKCLTVQIQRRIVRLDEREKQNHLLNLEVKG